MFLALFPLFWYKSRLLLFYFLFLIIPTHVKRGNGLKGLKKARHMLVRRFEGEAEAHRLKAGDLEVLVRGGWCKAVATKA